MSEQEYIEFNFRNPDYTDIFAERAASIKRISENPQYIDTLKSYYKDHPSQFIFDWGMTFDPRNAEIGMPSNIPFVLFERQDEYIDFLHRKWLERSDGVVEKSRDMGVSWLCVGFAVWMWLFHSGTVVGFGSRKEEYVDKIGDPKSLFWKIRYFIDWLPPVLRPRGWKAKVHAPFMRIVNPENGSSIVGEAGDNIGRGNRTSIYFKDEAAHFEHAEAIDAALSQTSNCKIDVSTPNGAGNPFYKKAHGGIIEKFVFDWHDDPRKDQAWYDKQVSTLDAAVVAQEIDRNYEASVQDAFIHGDIAKGAAARGVTEVQAVGKLRIGVDVARFGGDKTCISTRRGRVLLDQRVYSKLDVVQVASQVRNVVKSFGEIPEQIAVDTIGIGSGVADILRGWYPDKFDRNNKRTQIVVDVNCAIRMSDGDCYNLRAYMWKEMRDWLKTASIINDHNLVSELTALRYKFKGGELLLESKDDAKRRGVSSPDRADSLALTFAYPTIMHKRKPVQFKARKITVRGMGI